MIYVLVCLRSSRSLYAMKHDLHYVTPDYTRPQNIDSNRIYFGIQSNVRKHTEINVTSLGRWLSNNMLFRAAETRV